MRVTMTKGSLEKEERIGPLMALLFSCYLVACIVFPVHTVAVVVSGRAVYKRSNNNV